MGIGYVLINNTKKECISFSHLGAIKINEIIGNPITATISTWYLLKNSGDEIGFYPDSISNKNDLPFPNITWKNICNYTDVTNKIIDELIQKKILQDEGKTYFDENEPDVYIRNLKNIWYD